MNKIKNTIIFKIDNKICKIIQIKNSNLQDKLKKYNKMIFNLFCLNKQYFKVMKVNFKKFLIN